MKSQFEERIQKLENENRSLREAIEYIWSKLPTFELKTGYQQLPMVSIFQDGEMISNTKLLTPPSFDLLLKWLGVDSGVLRLTLKYRASRDGYDYNSFRKYCWHQGPPVIIFIKSKEYPDIFGGYTTAVLSDSSHKTGNEPVSVYDKNAFVFNLNQKTKYPVKNPEELNISKDRLDNIHSGKWMLAFGWNNLPDIGIGHDPQKGQASECNFSLFFAPSSPNEFLEDAKNPEKLAGGQKFTVEEMELFVIETPALHH